MSGLALLFRRRLSYSSCFKKQFSISFQFSLFMFFRNLINCYLKNPNWKLTQWKLKQKFVLEICQTFWKLFLNNTMLPKTIKSFQWMYLLCVFKMSTLKSVLVFWRSQIPSEKPSVGISTALSIFILLIIWQALLELTLVSNQHKNIRIILTIKCLTWL